jgi:hypothetical protein
MIIDCVTYNGERDILRLRLNALKGYVDEFIIVEAPTTFSGHSKPLYFPDFPFDISPFNITYHIIDENYSAEEMELARNSPNTAGAEHWQREFLQKESIKKALAHLEENDVVFIGDVDEIWDENALDLMGTKKLKLKVYVYRLNNRSNEQFWGTIITPYRNVRDGCLNHLRTSAPKTLNYYGWHFTSMGGYEELRRKLESSYTEETYWNPWVQENLRQNIAANRDFLSRDFEYWVDESEWPEYLKRNREDYSHLLE